MKQAIISKQILTASECKSAQSAIGTKILLSPGHLSAWLNAPLFQVQLTTTVSQPTELLELLLGMGPRAFCSHVMLLHNVF